MDKLKWHYDKKFKQWWIHNAGGGFTLKKGEYGWELMQRYKLIHIFNKLSSAKKVAELIHTG